MEGTAQNGQNGLLVERILSRALWLWVLGQVGGPVRGLVSRRRGHGDSTLLLALLKANDAERGHRARGLVKCLGRLVKVAEWPPARLPVVELGRLIVDFKALVATYMGCPITRWYIDRPDALGHVLAHRLGCFGVRFRARGFHCQAHGRRLLALVLLLGRHLCLLGRLCRLGRGLRRLGEDLGHVLPRRRWLVVDLLLLGHLPMTLRRGIGRAPRRLLLPLWLPWDHGPRRLAATARVHRWRVLPQAPVRRAARCGAINFTQRRRRAAHSYTSALAKVRQKERGGASL